MLYDGLMFFGLSVSLINFYFPSSSSTRNQVHIHLDCQRKVKEIVGMKQVPKLAILVKEEGL